jgi:hypothetical protein
MARTVRQDLPSPPAIYDQAYIAQLAEAINRYMVQREAPAEVIAARFILVDPLEIPGDVPDTTGLPTGMLYLAKPPGWVTGGPYFLTIVLGTDK